MKVLLLNSHATPQSKFNAVKMIKLFFIDFLFKVAKL